RSHVSAPGAETDAPVSDVVADPNDPVHAAGRHSRRLLQSGLGLARAASTWDQGVATGCSGAARGDWDGLRRRLEYRRRRLQPAGRSRRRGLGDRSHYWTVPESRHHWRDRFPGRGAWLARLPAPTSIGEPRQQTRDGAHRTAPRSVAHAHHFPDDLLPSCLPTPAFLGTVRCHFYPC